MTTFSQYFPTLFAPLFWHQCGNVILYWLPFSINLSFLLFFKQVKNTHTFIKHLFYSINQSNLKSFPVLFRGSSSLGLSDPHVLRLCWLAGLSPVCLSVDKVLWKAETESSQHSGGHGEWWGQAEWALSVWKLGPDNRFWDHIHLVCLFLKRCCYAIVKLVLNMAAVQVHAGHNAGSAYTSLHLMPLWWSPPLIYFY